MKDNINQIAYYKSLVYDAKKKIKNAKEAEFNTDMYESVLNQIINKEYNEKDYKIHVDAYSNINYLDRITNLENLIKELDKIEVYIKTFNIACYVDMQLDKEHISSYNVNNLVNIMLESLGEIKNMDIYSEDIDKVEKKFFSIIYKLIKYEIIIKNNSTLYDYIITNDTNRHFLDECINNNIEKLDLSNSKYQKIQEKIYELNSKGSISSYFDLEMIKLLLAFEDGLEIKENIYSQLNEFISNIDSSNDRLNTKLSDLHREKQLLKEVNGYLKNHKKSIRKSIVSLVLTLSIVGSGFGIEKIGKKICTSDGYKRKITTYSEWNGLNNKDVIIDADDVSEYDDKVYLKKYGVWAEQFNGTYERQVDIYNVSNFYYDNIEDYLKYDLESYRVEPEIYSETVNSGEISQFYTKEYTEVEINDIDTSVIEPYLNEDGYVAFNTLIYTLYAVFLILIAIPVSYFDLKNIIKTTKEFFSDKVDMKKKISIISSLNNEILELLNSNKNLENKFTSLYNSKKYLLENPEELYKELEETINKLDDLDVFLEDKEVKKIMKKKKYDFN